MIFRRQLDPETERRIADAVRRATPKPLELPLRLTTMLELRQAVLIPGLIVRLISADPMTLRRYGYERLTRAKDGCFVRAVLEDGLELEHGTFHWSADGKVYWSFHDDDTATYHFGGPRSVRLQFMPPPPLAIRPRKPAPAVEEVEPEPGPPTLVCV